MHRFPPRFPVGVRCAAACLAVAALLALAGCLREAVPAPRAEGGVLDLRDWNPAETGPAALDGAWAFYWDRLLQPADFAPGRPAPAPTGSIALPGTWQGVRVGGQKLGGTGQATFRLRITLRPDLRQLTLRLYDLPMAYRLWADGRLVAESGRVGTDAASEIPRRSLVLAEVEPDRGRLELVLQVSNHHFRAGGVPESIRIAPPGPLEAARDRQWALSFLFAGCLLISAVYHLFLFSRCRKLRSALYFGIYCLLMLGYCMTSDTSFWAADRFLPPLPPGAAEYVPLSCFLALGPFLYRFFKSLYPQEIHSFIGYVVDIRLALYLVLLPLAPAPFLSRYIVLGMLVGSLYGMYYIQRLFVCVRRGRNGAGLLLAGSLLFLFASLNDILAHSGITHTPYLIEPGMFLLVAAQSLTLARRFTHAMEAEERLTAELRHKNASLMAEMEERNRLEREVVNISEEERRRISHELHDGLCQKLTGARLRAAILNQRLSGTGESAAMAGLAALLEASADDAYSTARGLWPVEHDPAVPGPSLEDLARRIARDTGIAVHFERHCHCGECTNPNVTTLYRIAQEGLTNAARHARARTIRLELRCPAEDGVALTVRDDGIGRAAASREHSGGAGLGLGIMAHRAAIIHADLRITDGPDGGTEVRCIAPCERAATLADTRRRTDHGTR